MRPAAEKDERLLEINRRFVKATPRRLRRKAGRPLRIETLLLVLIIGSLFAGFVFQSVRLALKDSEPMTLAQTAKHLAAAPNCGAARMVGLAPARRGEPGYYPRHDRDGDGWACELVGWPS